MLFVVRGIEEMSFREMMASIRYALGSVLRFSGRDGRGLFWPWAILVFLLGQVAYMMAMVPAILSSMMRAMEAAQRGDFGPDGQPNPAAIAQLTAQMGADFGGLWISFAVIHAITVVALAAAVTRRLHDRDRTVLWGLLPLPFMAMGIVLMPDAFAFAASPAQASTGMKLLGLSSPLFWGSFVWLVVLLAGEGTEGPNRFGDATRDTP